MNNKPIKKEEVNNSQWREQRVVETTVNQQQGRETDQKWRFHSEREGPILGFNFLIL